MITGKVTTCPNCGKLDGKTEAIRFSSGKPATAEMVCPHACVRIGENLRSYAKWDTDAVVVPDIFDIAKPVRIERFPRGASIDLPDQPFGSRWVEITAMSDEQRSFMLIPDVESLRDRGVIQAISDLAHLAL